VRITYSTASNSNVGSQPEIYTSGLIANAGTGLTVSWNDASDFSLQPFPGGLGSVQSVQILGADSAGNYKVLRQFNGAPPAATVVRTQSQYDAFGEITAQGTYLNGATPAMQQYFDYDQDGRLWLTNQGKGVATAYLYDVQGHATAQIQSQQVDLGT